MTFGWLEHAVPPLQLEAAMHIELGTLEYSLHAQSTESWRRCSFVHTGSTGTVALQLDLYRLFNQRPHPTVFSLYAFDLF